MLLTMLLPFPGPLLFQNPPEFLYFCLLQVAVGRLGTCRKSEAGHMQNLTCCAAVKPQSSVLFSGGYGMYPWNLRGPSAPIFRVLRGSYRCLQHLTRAHDADGDAAD
jgi:hypothetical protein